MVEIGKHPFRIRIEDDAHAVVAAHQARRLAVQLGFSLVEQTALSTAILEVTRNIVKYAGVGEITLDTIQNDSWAEVIVVAHDDGPGILDIELALRDGYSTGKSLGLGLPGARRLMDTFEITSQPGHGTTVTMKKWKR